MDQVLHVLGLNLACVGHRPVHGQHPRLRRRVRVAGDPPRQRPTVERGVCRGWPEMKFSLRGGMRDSLTVHFSSNVLWQWMRNGRVPRRDERHRVDPLQQSVRCHLIRLERGTHIVAIIPSFDRSIRSFIDAFIPLAKYLRIDFIVIGVRDRFHRSAIRRCRLHGRCGRRLKWAIGREMICG